jgi:6-phosphogluconolactonase
MAGCSANKNVYPALPASHAAPRPQARHFAMRTISREFVYVANQGSNNVSAYRVRSGALEQVPGSPFPAGNGSGSVGIDQSGGFAYVTDQNYPSQNGMISAYKINPTSGKLKTIPGSPFSSDSSPYAVAIDPLGEKFLYVANIFGNDVTEYKIGRLHGALKAGPRADSCCYPESIAVDPFGRFVFVPNTATNNVSAYTIDPLTGTLTQVAGSPFASGYTPNSAAVDPSGAFLYVINAGEGTISGYAINQSSGALAALAGSPFWFGSCRGPIAIAIDPSGSFAYVANNQAGICAFAIGPNTGALKKIRGSPFGAGSSPNRLTVDLRDKYVYVSNTTNTISAYAIDPSSGALTEVAGSPFAAGTGPAGIAVWGVP